MYATIDIYLCDSPGRVREALDDPQSVLHTSPDHLQAHGYHYLRSTHWGLSEASISYGSVDQQDRTHVEIEKILGVHATRKLHIGDYRGIHVTDDSCCDALQKLVLYFENKGLPWYLVARAVKSDNEQFCIGSNPKVGKVAWKK